MVDDHDISGTREDDYWHLVCDCGWTADVVGEDKADEVVDAHLEESESDMAHHRVDGVGF